MIVVIIELVGILLTSLAYIRIYKVVRYHQNQIQYQLQLPNAQILQEKKSAFNSLFVLCCFPSLLSSTIELSSVADN